MYTCSLRAGANLSDDELRELSKCWHQLPASNGAMRGLEQFRRGYVVVATAGAGQLALLASLAKHAKLPWDVSAVVPNGPQEHSADGVATAAANVADELGLRPGQVLLVASDPAVLSAAAARGLRTAWVAVDGHNIGNPRNPGEHRHYSSAVDVWPCRRNRFLLTPAHEHGCTANRGVEVPHRYR